MTTKSARQSTIAVATLAIAIGLSGHTCRSVADAQQKLPLGSFTLKAHANGGLDVVANEASTVSLLKEVSRSTGLDVFIHGDIDEKVSISQEYKKLEPFLATILRKNDYAVALGDDKKNVNVDANNDRESEGGKLWIYPLHANNNESNEGVYPIVIIDGEVQQGDQYLAVIDSGATAIDIEDSESDASRDESLNEGLETAAGAPVDDATPSTIVSNLTHADARERAKAAYKLSTSRDENAVHYLSGLLGDSDQLVQSEAIESLITIGSDAAIDSLASAFSQFDVNRRAEVIDSIGAMEQTNHAGARRLVARGLRDQDAEVRSVAVGALMQMNGDEAKAMLKQTIGSSDGTLREQAAFALADMDAEMAKSTLRELMESSDEAMRTHAQEILSGL